MFMPFTIFRYLTVLLALFCQSQVFAIETDTISTTQDLSNLKGFGMDKRVKVLGALLLIFAPLGLMAYNKNRQVSLSKESKINILEKRSLDQNSSILLVEIQGTTLLLSKTSTGISLIKEVPTTPTDTNIAHEDKPYSPSKNVSLVSNNS